MSSRGFALLPPAPDACQVCAVKHDETEAHDPGSLYWQTSRALNGEAPPTWEDALEHLDDEAHARWREGLAGHGIEVPAR